MIRRTHYLKKIDEMFRVFPVTALLGSRQCGKTTLAHQYAKQTGMEKVAFYDLENPTDLARLSAPMTELERRSGLVVLDEIQRRPELFELLRVLADRPTNPARFLVLGSASPYLVRGVSETLAGRIGFVDMTGFTLDEVNPEAFRKLWLRGGFPRSFLAPSDTASAAWREGFVRTFLERDIPQFGFSIPAEALRRFWTMTAHYHGQVWNAAEFARSLATSESTAKRYLELLEGAYMVRRLLPWHENLKKRQVKAPKVFIRDSGITHSLLGLHRESSLLGHPKLGASWEGFVIEQIAHAYGIRDIYFWRTYAGAELDVILFRDGKRHGFEIKYSDAPNPTKSMRIAIEDLGLESLTVVYPGTVAYQLHDRIFVKPVVELSRPEDDDSLQ